MGKSKNSQETFIKGLQLLRKTPCQLENHDDQNYSLLCVNEQCSQKGGSICVYCLTEQHDHSGQNPSENFISIKKVENYLQEGRLSKDMENSYLKQMTEMMEGFIQFKEGLQQKLNEIEINIQDQIEQMQWICQEYDDFQVTEESIQKNDIDTIREQVQQFGKNIYMENKDIQVLFDGVNNFQKNNNGLKNVYIYIYEGIMNVQNQFDSLFQSLNSQKEVEDKQIQIQQQQQKQQLQQVEEAEQINNSNIQEQSQINSSNYASLLPEQEQEDDEDEDDYTDLLDKDTIKEIMLKFGLSEEQSIEVLKNYNGDKIETMVHLEKKAEEQKKFEGMDNLLKKKKKGKRNKSKILEMSAQ